MRSRFLAVLAAVGGLASQLPSFGQCGSTWTAGPAPAVNGVNGPIYASLSWDHDNIPGTPNRLVVGGEFTLAGATLANNLAMWDGTRWHKFGAGTTGPVRALAAYNGQLVIGGEFLLANNVLVNHIARWNGATFAPFGEGVAVGDPLGMPRVEALLVNGANLHAGGYFTTAGGVAASNIARWNGSAWSAMDVGLPAQVNVLATWDGIFGSLVVAGDSAGSVSVWDGSDWAALGEAMTSYGCSFGGLIQCASVRSMLITSTAMYAGGLWLHIGQSAGETDSCLHGLAAFDFGSEQWVNTGVSCAFGPGGFQCSSVFGSPVEAIVEYGGEIIAGSRRWSGLSWALLGGGVAGAVHALTVHNGELYACGEFASAGGVAASNIARWNGIAWSAIAPSTPVRALVGGPTVFAGGDFTYDLAGGPASHVVHWNGTALAPLAEFPDVGQGVNGPVHALKVLSQFPNTTVYAGGQFTTAGGGGNPAAVNIAQYSFSSISSLANWSAMGAGLNNIVHAIEIHQGQVYAGGAFTLSGATTVNRIARWDSVAAAWQPVSTAGMNGPVLALVSHGGFLYAGGTFTFAGGNMTGSLARWDGASWSSVGGVFSGTARALAVHNGELVIGGTFPNTITGSANIGRHNGAAFLPVGTGTGGTIHALTSFNGDLYAGGEFTAAGGISASHIARWNAADGWQAMGSGVNGTVLALRGSDARVHVGGMFASAGGIDTPFWAVWAPNVAPGIASGPYNSFVLCGDSAAFSVATTSSSIAPTFQWRHEGSNLVDGPQPNGSTVSGSTTATLTIIDARQSNSGDYDVVVSNACGSTTSHTAVLLVLDCCVADISPNGVVDVNDLLAVITTWGSCPAPCPPNCAADIAPLGPPSGNCQVDVNDLLAVVTTWGPCP